MNEHYLIVGVNLPHFSLDSNLHYDPFVLTLTIFIICDVIIFNCVKHWLAIICLYFEFICIYYLITWMSDCSFCTLYSWPWSVGRFRGSRRSPSSPPVRMPGAKGSRTPLTTTVLTLPLLLDSNLRRFTSKQTYDYVSDVPSSRIGHAQHFIFTLTATLCLNIRIL